jgi:hypothetical protein
MMVHAKRPKSNGVVMKSLADAEDVEKRKQTAKNRAQQQKADSKGV